MDCALEYTININVSIKEIVASISSPHLSQFILAKPNIKIDMAAESYQDYAILLNISPDSNC